MNIVVCGRKSTVVWCNLTKNISASIAKNISISITIHIGFTQQGREILKVSHCHIISNALDSHKREHTGERGLSATCAKRGLSRLANDRRPG